MITTLERSPNTYNPEYDVVTDIQNLSDLNNKLFCTFTTLEELDGLLAKITSNNAIMYNKIFVLHIKSNNEYVIFN